MGSMVNLAIFLVAVSVIFPESSGENFGTCPTTPETCTPENCKLPDCSCAGNEPNVTLNKRPQIVYLTFDDGLRADFDRNYFREIFLENNYKNPNGCPIRGTFFVNAASNDFVVANKYYRHGHEFAVHSITHKPNTTYWRTLSDKLWADEMGGMREMLAQFADIPMEEIRGIRAPFLQGGGDEMFNMLVDEGFTYDCSAPTRYFGFTRLDSGRWPYTNDYKNDMDCQIKPCPHCNFPGIWSQPMLDLEDNWVIPPADHGQPCAMLDSCISPTDSFDEVFRMLKRNFDRTYNGRTRAPFGLYTHAAWFVGRDWRFEAYKNFLNYALTNRDDVWIVPVWNGIQYMQNPMTVEQLKNNQFEPFNCQPPEPDMCRDKMCKYEHAINDEEIYMHICEPNCPVNFPWLGNPMGN